MFLMKNVPTNFHQTFFLFLFFRLQNKREKIAILILKELKEFVLLFETGDGGGGGQ